MHTIQNNENTPASMVAISQSLGGPRTKPADRSLSPSPSPGPIRKTRALQSLNSNQVLRRVLGDDKENHRPNQFSQRQSGVKLEEAAVILQQPPTHFNIISEAPPSHSAHHPVAPNPSFQQVQLGLIPLSNQWTQNQTGIHPGRVGNVDDTQRNPISVRSYARGDLEGHEVDPFAQLSSRTLALMEQPESEMTIYDCEYCDKTYQGKHARSIWRRHLSDKHKIPLSTQPRRTRWDNDANRPKTEEERRERTLESKRRWARKNRAAKKAARDGQRSSIDQSVGGNLAESVATDGYRPSPNRSRAPSPSSFPVTLGHSANNSLQYCAGTGHLARSQSTQGEPRGQLAGMTRGSSVPHAFSPYPPVASRAPFQFGNASYNPSFCFPQVPTQEWTFPMPYAHNPTPYSFETMASNGHGHPPGQFSERFTHEGLQQNASPRNYHHLTRRHSLTSYAADHQQVGEPRELPEGYSDASLTSQYGHWELDGRFNMSSSLPVNLTQLDTSSYENQSKRPRLSQPSSTSVPLQKLDDLQKSYAAYSLDGSADSRDFQSIGIQDPTKSAAISSSDTLQVNFKHSPGASVRDEEANSDLGAITEERLSPTAAQDDFHPMLNSPMHSQSRVDDCQPVRPATSGTLSSMSRPATSGTLSSMSHEGEMDRVMPMNRAATEPQFAVRYDLQTPNRELRIRSAGKLHLVHSPICRADAHRLDATDLLSSPAVTRADSTHASLYQGHYAPMSTGKRVVSEGMQIQPLASSSSMSVGDWNNHVLDTPSGFSRFAFNNGLPSPVGGTGLFGSPNSNLSKSLGLSLNNSVSGDDCLGGFLGSAASTWDIIHQRNSS